jgi:hypothetical protein
MVTFSIKQRNNNGQWTLLPLGRFSGKTLKQVLLDMDGKEVVAEFNLDGKLCYFCGTEAWLERMKKKAPAVLFGNAVNRLRDTRPDLLEEILPVDVAMEFGGEVESVSLFEETKKS